MRVPLHSKSAHTGSFQTKGEAEMGGSRGSPKPRVRGASVRHDLGARPTPDAL